MASRHPYTLTPLTTRAPWVWWGVGITLGLLLTVLFFAPARWLAQSVEKASDNRVQLRSPVGSVWTGSAQLVLSGGSGSLAQTALPGRVEWKIRPSLQGLRLTVSAACCLAQGWMWTVTPRVSGVHISTSDLNGGQPSQWPSALLAGLGTPWNTLRLDGVLALSTEQLELDLNNGQWTLAGRVQLDANNLATALSVVKPLGSYRLVLMGGATPTLDLTTLQGNLQLSGSGRWVGNRLQFEGEASASPEQSEALGNLLNIIGRREGARSIIKVG